MEQDGTNFTNLTLHTPWHDSAVRWSPDGQWLAFVSERNGSDDIWLMQADGTNPLNLTPEMPSMEHSPVWSPDGHYMAFVSSQGGQWAVWVMEVKDGAQPRRISPLDEHSYTRPSWLSDSQTVIFLGGGEHANIWKANVKEASLVPLLSNGTGRIGPANPEACATNDLIAFADISENVLGELWVMNSDGTDMHNLTAGNGGSAPVWSPDGEMILFRSLRGGYIDIWRMDNDGTGAINLTNRPTTDFSPVWSPDGTQIVFSSAQLGNSDIDVWLMDADGTNPHNLTTNQNY